MRMEIPAIEISKMLFFQDPCHVAVRAILESNVFQITDVVSNVSAFVGTLGIPFDISKWSVMSGTHFITLLCK